MTPPPPLSRRVRLWCTGCTPLVPAADALGILADALGFPADALRPIAEVA